MSSTTASSSMSNIKPKPNQNLNKCETKKCAGRATKQQQPKAQKNRQAVQRIAHLHAVARLLASQGGQQGQMLARLQAESLFTLAEKSQVRLTLPQRRSFCRRCRLPLVSGVTTDIRCRRRRRRGGDGQLVAVVTCRLCRSFASYGFRRHDWVEAVLPSNGLQRKLRASS